MFASSLLKRRYFAFLAPTTLTLLSLLLVGCGGGAPASLLRPATTPTETMPQGGNAATVTLKPAPEGTATLTWDYTNQMLTVEMTLSGLAPNSVHPAHIHEGDCSKDGKILYPLINLTADAHGVGHATSKFSVPKGIPASGWSIHAHNGPGLSDAEQKMPLACGNIVNHDTSLRSNQTAQVMLAATPEQNVSGTAHLTLNNRVLTVQMTLTGLSPKTSHAAHIHAGSCASQGSVVYNLPTITADASGKATLNTTIQDVSTIPAQGWYINVHRSTDISTQTGFDPVSCGDVTLS